MNKMTEGLTPKERLAVSRAELLGAMGYRALPSSAGGVDSKEGDERVFQADPGRRSRSLLGAWWDRHPMSGVVQLANPLLERYAARHPGRLLAYGAGTGALLVVTKPWRLLSAATVVALLFRTADVAGLMGDLVARVGRRPTNAVDLPDVE